MPNGTNKQSRKERPADVSVASHWSWLNAHVVLIGSREVKLWHALITLAFFGGLTTGIFALSDQISPRTQAAALPATIENTAQLAYKNAVGAAQPAVTSNRTVTNVQADVPQCNTGSWQNAGCGQGGCAQNQMYQTRTVTPAGCTTTSQCVADASCAGPTLTCDQTGSNNFAACYYNNRNLSGNPVVTRTDNSINFDWGSGSPASGVNIDNFSTRWQGNFTFEQGDYDFTVTTDDGFRLYLDNTLILNQWKDQAPTTYTVTKTLTTGSHLLKAEFYENGGRAVARLSWQKKTGPPADTVPPTVSLTAPAVNTTVSGTVTLSATASDNVGVTRVEFIVDGTVKSTDTASPYSFSWDTTNSGAHPCSGPHTHTLSARASDAVNNQGASANVTVNMNNPVYCGSSDTTPPTISTFDVQPRSGPGPFTLTWSVSDDEPTPVCIPFATLTVDAKGIPQSTPQTTTGKSYRLTSSGTYNYWIPNTDTLADAEYADTTRVPGYPQGWNDTTDGGLELQVNGQDLIWGSAYNPNHTYTTTIPGNGQSIAFKIFDSYYPDNQGSLSVTVEECGTGGGGNLCGNPPGIIDPGEQCDGANLNGQTCQSLGFSEGTPACTAQCTFDTSGCTTSQQCTPLCGAWSDPANQCGTRSCTRADCSTYADIKNCGTTYDPRQGHTYPRTAVFQWGGGVPEWYARFDLNMTRETGASFISQVRQKNSNTLWLPARDFNRGDEFISNFPEQWFLRDSKGNKIQLYSPETNWADLSDLGVRVNGQRMIDYFPQVLADLVNNTGADGIATDGLYYRLHLQYGMFSDVDLDRNCPANGGTGNPATCNDLIEHGKQWVIDHWANGVDQFLSNLRSRLGDKIIMINSGSPDTPGLSLVNGYVGEHIGGVVNWDYDRQWFADTVSRVSSPPIFLMNSNPDGGDPKVTRPSKNYFSFMRFGLGRAMLLGYYFEFEDLESGEHYFNKYYDEFDVNVGYPTGSLQQVRSGVWARFFDDGAVIVNINPRDETVSDQDIRGLSGYAGPYYRFRGGQDPVMNNGAQFNSVMLHGHSFLDYSGNTTIAGDAVLLVRSPQTVISDIIIDNVGGGTSPSSSKASLTGTWTEGCDELGSNFYTLRCASWVDNSVNVAVSTAGGATATFRPTIGVAGNYEVYEWHGRLSSGSLASNVTYTINQAGGSTNRTVNQQTNPGQWNSLGTYRFNAGTSGNVTISASGANGTVMADAIKFVYRVGSSAATTPPTRLASTPRGQVLGAHVTASGVASIEPWWSATACAQATPLTWQQLDILSPSATSYPHTGAIEGKNCYGIHVKDTAGNETNEAAQGKGPLEVVKTAAASIDYTVAIGSVTMQPGATVNVPVAISSTDKVFFSYGLTVAYDPAVVKATGVVKAGTLTAGWGNPMVNLSQPGQMTVAVGGTVAVPANGTLVNLVFQAVGAAGDRSDVTLPSATIEEVPFSRIERVPGSITIQGFKDTTPPTISAFDVQPRSGEGPFTVSWTAFDNPGGSGLKEIQVWRSATTCAVATASSPTWQKLSTLSGTATSHQDNPSSSGSYCYGLHAVDNVGLEQDERQAGKGPLEVVKTSITLPPLDSLISSYSFDDGQGTRLTDSTGSHHGTLVNMENQDWVAGKTGGALQFDGVNEYVTIPHSPAFELASGKISFWFKLNSLNPDQTLLSKDHIGYTEGGHLTIAFDLTPDEQGRGLCYSGGDPPPADNALAVRLQSLDRSFCIYSDPSTTFQTGRWYQAEFWFGDGGMRLAINGVMQQDTDPYTGGIETNHEPIILGAGNWYNPTTPLLRYTATALDELKIERLVPADGGGGGECVFKQTLTIPSDQNSQTTTSFSLTQGVRYRLTASGTYQYWLPGHPTAVADAEWAETTDLDSPGWTNPSNFELLVDGQDRNWGSYRPDHRYTLDLQGTNAPLSFRILDNYYPDNRGSLAVRVEECVTGGAQDTTPPQVTSFTLKNPNRTTQDPAAFNWTVSDNQALKQVELWRAPFVSGSCDDATKANCGWGVLSGNVQAVSGTSASAPPLPSLTDDPAPGTYFYGLHAVDQAGNVGVEPQLVKVVKTSPPQCQITVWIPQGCGQGGCSSTQRYQTRTEGCGGATSQCAADPSCTPATQKGSPDLNGDDTVGVGDLGIFVGDWGRTDKPPSDINQDGIVNVSDLGILFHFWGQRRGTCGFPEQVCISVESCLGKCDLSGNTCMKTDPQCGVSTACDVTVALNTSQRFDAQAQDPEGDQLFYTFNWGDTTTSKQPSSGYVDSGTARYADKTWATPSPQDGYSVTFRATDSKGNPSELSDTLRVCVQGGSTSAQCSDGIDNDGDQKIDFGTGTNNDPGCSSSQDNDETDSSPACIPFQTLTVDSMNAQGISTARPTAAGKSYRLTSSGTYNYWAPNTDTLADAEYADTTRVQGYPDGWNNTSDGGLELQVNNQDLIWGSAYNPNHTYTTTIPGNGQSIAFKIHDSYYADNQGSLTVRIEECDTGGGGNLCGNGRIDGNEQCDGTNLGGATCPAGQTGSPTCTASCTLDTSNCTSGPQCTPACGAWSDATNQCGSRTCTRTDCSTYADTRSCTPIDPRQGHTYPRSFVFTWCCQPPAYYAKFDIVMSRMRDRDIIAQAKQLNPNMLWLPSIDLNTALVPSAGDPYSRLSDDWALRDSQGNTITLGGLYGGDPFTDMSDLGARVNGQRFIDYFPEFIADFVRQSGADGFASDGLYYRGHVGWYGWDDIDLDRNGVNDNIEHGKDWVTDHWGDGIDFMLNKLRQLLGPDKFIFINTGSGDIPTPSAINGIYMEHAPPGLDTIVSARHGDMYPPSIFTVNFYGGDPRDPQSPTPKYNDYQFMRLGLARSMLEDAYLDWNTWESGEHYWSEYVDEFDLDIGYPTGGRQQIRANVWARFFDSGAVIGNFNDFPVTVTDQDLRSLSGYVGPYYWRFQGCQDPAVNNGERFTSIQLKGHGYTGYSDAYQTVGDGIVLVSQPTRACPTIPRPPGGYWRDNR